MWCSTGKVFKWSGGLNVVNRIFSKRLNHLVYRFLLVVILFPWSAQSKQFVQYCERPVHGWALHDVTRTMAPCFELQWNVNQGFSKYGSRPHLGSKQIGLRNQLTIFVNLTRKSKVGVQWLYFYCMICVKIIEYMYIPLVVLDNIYV